MLYQCLPFVWFPGYSLSFVLHCLPRIHHLRIVTSSQTLLLTTDCSIRRAPSISQSDNKAEAISTSSSNNNNTCNSYHVA